MIILGVDPGLTRCGVGVIEAGAYRRLSFIHVDVVRSDPKTSQDLRLLAIYNGLVEKIERFAPDAVSIERVFAQENRNTVLGNRTGGRVGDARCGATRHSCGVAYADGIKACNHRQRQSRENPDGTYGGADIGIEHAAKAG